jgi:pyruvate, water dikinase
VVEQHIPVKADDGDEMEPRPAVTEEAPGELVGFGLKLEAYFGGPQDIEWAENQKGERVILQSRPLGLTRPGEQTHPFDHSGLKHLFSAGQTASPGRVSGRAVHASAELRPEAAEDVILVARTAASHLAPLMGRVRGLIADLGGAASDLASVAREFRVPALVDTRKATALIPDGAEITLLADEGEVYPGLIPELARKLPAEDAEEKPGPINHHLRDLLERISPLNLTDPRSPEFAPIGCRTLHDLIRFAHEKPMDATANAITLQFSCGASMTGTVSCTIHSCHGHHAGRPLPTISGKPARLSLLPGGCEAREPV